MNQLTLIASLSFTCLLLHCPTLTNAAADDDSSRPLIDQISERIRLLERDFELLIRQFSRTVLGMDVHSTSARHVESAAAAAAAAAAASAAAGVEPKHVQRLQSIEGRADPAAGSTDTRVPTVIPGMGVLSNWSTGGNPLAVLQQLLMGILAQFQSLLRTLTSLPGSEILGRR